jgi:transketolase
LVGKALEAARQLASSGIRATVINNPFVNRIDIETIGHAVAVTRGRVVTIEDHQIIGGMGAQISHALSQSGMPHRIRTLGIAGDFGQSAYLAEHLYERHGLTAERMADAAAELMER